MLRQASHPMTPRFIFYLSCCMFLQISFPYHCLSVTYLLLGGRQGVCVFNVSKRRRSWILGQVVSLWAGVLCNHTHKHSEDSHQECRAGMQRRRNLPPTSTHTHTFFSHCLLNPTPCQALIPQKVRQEETADCPPLHFQIRNLGPTVYCPKSHCWASASLSRGFLFTISPYSSQIVQCYRTVISPKTCF